MSDDEINKTIQSSIDKIISDEVLRNKLSKILKEPDKYSWHKHPLTTVITGFILTGILGFLFTETIKSNQLENQKAIEQTKASKEAGLQEMNKMSELLNERYFGTYVFASALKRKAPIQELEEKKRLYETASYKWRIQSQALILRVRFIFNDRVSKIIIKNINLGLIKNYNIINKNLINGYDSTLNRLRWQYPTELVRNSLSQCERCNQAITNYLWVKTYSYGNENNNAFLIKNAENQFSASCNSKE